MKKEVVGYAYYGIHSVDTTWDSRFFKILNKKPKRLPEIGDIVEAIGSVNARSGYIAFDSTRGWVNKSVIGLIKPADRLKVLGVNPVLGSFIWIKFKRI